MTNRFQKIRNILIFILILNWLVALAKLVYGYVSRCSSMTADGFHSFADGASNIIGIVGIWVASHPVDKEHPYGHKKYETLASMAIGVLLFIISFDIMKDGIARLFHPVLPDITLGSFIIMVSTIAVNIFVFIYERMKAGEHNSDILKADSEHTRTDILVSFSVLFTLLAIRSGYIIADTIVSMLIALFIGYAGFHILRESSDVLCDRAVMVADVIREIVLRIDGVRDCHKVRTRGRSDDIHVDLHVLVDPKMKVTAAHELNDSIEKAIKSHLKGVTEVSIHIEPFNEKEQSSL